VDSETWLELFVVNGPHPNVSIRLVLTKQEKIKPLAVLKKDSFFLCI